MKEKEVGIVVKEKKEGGLELHLFWPWLVKYNRKYLLSTIIIVGGFWFGLKLLAWLYLGNNSWLYEFFNVTRFHCMMLGAIGAVLYERKIKWFMQGLTHWSTQTLIWVYQHFDYLYFQVALHFFLF